MKELLTKLKEILISEQAKKSLTSLSLVSSLLINPIGNINIRKIDNNFNLSTKTTSQVYSSDNITSTIIDSIQILLTDQETKKEAIIKYLGITENEFSSILQNIKEENDGETFENIINSLYYKINLPISTKYQVVENYLKITPKEFGKYIKNFKDISENPEFLQNQILEHFYKSSLLPREYKLEKVKNYFIISKEELEDRINYTIKKNSNLTREDAINSLYESTILPNIYKKETVLNYLHISSKELDKLVPYILKDKEELKTFEEAINYLYKESLIPIIDKRSIIFSYTNFSETEYSKFVKGIISESIKWNTGTITEEDIINIFHSFSLIPTEYKFQAIKSYYNLTENQTHSVIATCIGEATANSYIDLYAVANNMFNRLNCTLYPDNLYKVVTQPVQFTAFGSNAYYNNYNTMDSIGYQAACDMFYSGTIFTNGISMHNYIAFRKGYKPDRVKFADNGIYHFMEIEKEDKIIYEDNSSQVCTYNPFYYSRSLHK